MRSRYAISGRIQKLVAVAALCVCAACAYAALAHVPLALAEPVQDSDGQAASARVAYDEVDFAGEKVSPNGALHVQDMTGARRRPAETIAINKSYSRDASEYDDHTYRFKSKGGRLRPQGKQQGQGKHLLLQPLRRDKRVSDRRSNQGQKQNPVRRPMVQQGHEHLRPRND